MFRLTSPNHYWNKWLLVPDCLFQFKMSKIKTLDDNLGFQLKGENKKSIKQQRTRLLFNYSKRITITTLVGRFSPDISFSTHTVAEQIHIMSPASNDLTPHVSPEVYNQSLLMPERSAVCSSRSAAAGLNVESSCWEFPVLDQAHNNRITSFCHLVTQSAGVTREQLDILFRTYLDLS